MLAGILHQGSGLGNQLHRYVATRVAARDKGVAFGMKNPELFKGESFMNLDFGVTVRENMTEFHEKKVVENGVDIRGYDPEINFINDNTIIDGEFQDERYFNHRLNEVREWLQVEPLKTDDNLCVIGFRGGEYSVFPELFLTKDYWDDAIYQMLGSRSDMRFEVHTDDPVLAKQFFPDYPIIQDIALNWRSVRYAKYLIIANSSFYILPALLNQDVKHVIAARYWARRNIKIWALPSNFYSDNRWTYI